MIPSWLSMIASIGMAVGPPLVYADQAYSIVRKKYVGALRSLVQELIPGLGTLLGSQEMFALYCELTELLLDEYP